MIVLAVAGYGWLAWQVWLDTSRRHQNEMGRHQKGYTYLDRERGRLYWYLRSKHKLSRQVHGLHAQLDAERAQTANLERIHMLTREQLKLLQHQGQGTDGN